MIRNKQVWGITGLVGEELSRALRDASQEAWREELHLVQKSHGGCVQQVVASWGGGTLEPHWCAETHIRVDVLRQLAPVGHEHVLGPGLEEHGLDVIRAQEMTNIIIMLRGCLAI